MSVLELTRVRDRELSRLDLQLGPGIHVVLGGALDGAEALVAITAGLRPPRRGAVRVDGVNPHRDPLIRQRIGALFATERPTGDLVTSWVETALRARGAANTDPRAWLNTFQLGALSPRAVESLSASEVRAVALALALSVDSPALIALYEPLLVSGIAAETVVSAALRASQAGAVVLCVTSSVRSALLLSEVVMVLDRGRFVRRPEPAATELVPGVPLELVVETEQAAELAQALSRVAPHLEAVIDASAPRLVRVRGADLDATSRDILVAAHDAAIPVTSLFPAVPGAAHVRAATTELVRAAHARWSAT
jgi:ABC-type multidrug transport system ATPase subunit